MPIRTVLVCLLGTVPPFRQSLPSPHSLTRSLPFQFRYHIPPSDLHIVQKVQLLGRTQPSGQSGMRQTEPGISPLLPIMYHHSTAIGERLKYPFYEAG